MLDFLDGVSPFWWLALAFAMGAIEMLTFTTLLFWLALSAVATGGILFVWPDLGGEFQILTFALLSVAFTFAGRWATAHFDRRRQSDSKLNRPA